MILKTVLAEITLTLIVELSSTSSIEVCLETYFVIQYYDLKVPEYSVIQYYRVKVSEHSIS